MKVLYLINFAGKAGTEKYVENLIRAFHPDTCQCILGYHIDGPLVQRAQALQAQTVQIPMRGPLDLAAAKQLARYCREDGVDVVHAQYPRENMIAILSTCFGNPAKIVFTSHLTIAQPLAWRMMNRVFTRKNHRVISVCTAGAKQLEKNGIDPRQITVICNGVEPEKALPRHRGLLDQWHIGPEEVVLTILARLSPEKGLNFLLDVVARLKARTCQPFRVLVAGDGEMRGQLEQRLRQEGLEDTVLLLGYREDAAQILAASDVYLNTSPNEAMSYAILEAMASGLPIMATEVGGNQELVLQGEACGFCAPFGDVEEFSGKLQTLVEQEPLRQALGAAARRKAEHEYSLQHGLEELLKVYQE